MVDAVSKTSNTLRRNRSRRRISSMVPWFGAWMVLGSLVVPASSTIEAADTTQAATSTSSPAGGTSVLPAQPDESAQGRRAGCTVLKGESTYQQHRAPTDIMGLFSAIYERVNDNLDDVVKVEINYVGDVIHRLVGTHHVRATVTRLVPESEQGEVGPRKEECMLVRVVIEDTNECTLPVEEPMRHECDPSAVCVNTNGSYVCVCPNGEACVSKSGMGFCQDVNSSADCCSVDEVERPDGCRDATCARDCRRDFRCYTDQCNGKCVYPDMCTSSRGVVTCRCKEGEVGNGHVCPSATPQLFADAEGNLVSTDVDPAKVCGCQVPTVDLCHGVNCGQHSVCREMEGKAVCECKKGFRDVPGHGCMDDSAPSLKLKGPSHMKMKQCQKYREDGVEVIDANSENDDRQVGVSYSQPPGRCTPEMGSFTVNYTLNTEWTHPAVQYIVRHVTVEDIDECSLDPSSPEAQCPGCLPACHEHAKCENRVGTYTCKCPPCMSGDGFDPFIPRKSGRAPPGYEGGSGCRDSCRPVITLLGDNPLVLDVGISTDLLGRPIKNRNYTAELEDLILSTNGGGLCKEGGRCAKVLDNNGTHANVDITHRLTISGLSEFSKSPPQWRVTYTAVDLAGNYAEPITRRVTIQERFIEEYASAKVEEAMRKNCQCQPCPKCKSCDEEVALVQGRYQKQQQQQQQRELQQREVQKCPPCVADCTAMVTTDESCQKCSCRAVPDCVSKADCVATQPATYWTSWIGTTKTDQLAIATLLVLVIGLGFCLYRN